MSRDEETTPVETTDATQATQVETSPIPDAATSTPVEASDATQANTAEATTPATPVEATTPAAPAVKSPEEIAAEKAAAEKAMQDFQAAAQAAVDGADPATADLTQDSVDAVKEAFSKLDSGTPRTTAKKWLDERMKAEIGQVRVVQAKAFMTLGEAVKSTHATRETVVHEPVDPTKELVDRAAALYLSANFLTPGPEIAADWSVQTQKLAASLTGEVGTYRTYLAEYAKWEADPRPTKAPEGTPEGTEVDLKGEAPAEPQVSNVIRMAAKIAQGRPVAARKTRAPKGDGSAAPKVREPRSGERRDIKAHILEVFASLPVGTFLKFGEVGKAATSVAPAGDTSQGAVSARVKSPRWDVPSLVAAEEGGVQGIRKVS